MSDLIKEDNDFKDEATKNLKGFIEKFNKEQVSELVNAGFSKNTSRKFPLLEWFT